MIRVAILVLPLLSGAALAQGIIHHDGYVRRDGTYVQPHYQTAPDNNRMNNWSTQGNSNPYTGQRGYVDPYRPQQLPSLPSPGSMYNNQRAPSSIYR